MELDELISTTADGVCGVTSEGKVTLWNRSAEKILGHTARDVIGRPCCEVFVGRDAAGNRICYRGCHVQTLVKMGEPVQHFPMATRTKAGKPVWIDVSILVVPGSRSGLQTTIHLFRDVTAAHEMEALLRERLAQTRPAPAAVPVDSPTPLTRREIEIVRLMTSGANTRVMAEKLHVSPATIRNHVQNIFGKLGVHSRLEAVAHVTSQGRLS